MNDGAKEYDELNTYLNTLLTNYRDGKIELSNARGSLAEVIELAIKGAPNVRHTIRAHTQMNAREAD